MKFNHLKFVTYNHELPRIAQKYPFTVFGMIYDMFDTEEKLEVFTKKLNYAIYKKNILGYINYKKNVKEFLLKELCDGKNTSLEKSICSEVAYASKQNPELFKQACETSKDLFEQFVHATVNMGIASTKEDIMESERKLDLVTKCISQKKQPIQRSREI
ncbi:MAG: hypothetical protein WCR30_01965 [Clostridia bacterium]